MKSSLYAGFLVIEEKIFIYVKVPMHINAHTKFQLPLSITS